MVKPIYIRAEETLWRRFKKRAKSRGVLLVVAVREALTDWMAKA